MMTKSRNLIVIAALALGLAGAAAAVLWHPSPVRKPGGAFSGTEIAALVSGNTVKGPKFSEYYDPDGSVRGREIEDEDEEYTGSWHIEGDQLCVAFPSHDYKNCVSIVEETAGEYDFAGAGSHGRRTIVAGNPNKL